ncbi:MAG TPA: VWA domain-containing protein [Vicinamibacterales bacterium]|jgi:Ca-activated chloride channel family protein|nr:VWA domain-containing protein [Vicinamibacterales bacterium]
MSARLLGVSLAAAAVFTSVGVAVRAQQDGPTFKSGTGAIVSLFATVTDEQKRLVPDLQKEDFQVLDNDKPQPLTVFDNEVRPITVVVLLDMSGSMTNNLDRLRDACEQFLIRLLPKDKGQVGAFADRVQIAGPFTGNRDQLVREVHDLDYGNGTKLYDAVNVGLDNLKGIDGRRVIVVFTDGDDTASKAHLGNVLDRARTDDVMVYAIGFESEYFDGARMVRSKPDGGLQKLAEETGGGYFELKKSSDLGPTFSRVAIELHSQYVLGFEAKQLDGKVHKLALKMKQPGMTARARRSYVADPANIK